MADLSKITLPNGTIVSLKDAKKSGVYTVIGTQTQTTGAWTGDIDVNALYAGLTIAYFLPYSGSGNATLNLTLADGSTTGAKACYYNTTVITSQFPAGATILMTYWPAGSISVSGTPTSEDRWVAIANYDTNTNTWRNLTVNSAAWKSTSTSSGAANFADGTNITLATNSAALTISSNRYGACSTAAATAAKDVTIAGTFTLEAGAMAVVNFANKNTASSPTLNVNSTGAKNIFLGSSQITTGANKGALKGLCFFVYDGTQYRLVSPEITSSTTGNGNAITSISASNGQITATKDATFLTEHQVVAQDGIGGASVNRFAPCLTAAGTAAKTASITVGDLSALFNGVRVTVFFENKNTAASPTLNINNTGAVAIRHDGATLTGDKVGLLQGAIDFVYTEDMAWNLVGNYIDTNTTYTGTSPISVSGTSISHANSGATAGSYGDSSAQTPSYGGTFKVPYVTVDAKGHVTGISDHTVKIPASDNTTYTFANGTNGFTVTPSGGTAQTVTVTPSIPDATTSASGLMSSSDKTKLNGIATGAEVNQNAFSNVKVGNTTIAADSKTDTLTLVAGSNVTLTPDATNDKVTIASTDTNDKVTQTATTTNSDYEVLFSGTADNTTRTEGARKNTNLKFNPNTGNLQATQLNGVAIGSSPKFTDTVTTVSTSGSGNAVTALSASNGAITATKGSTFLTSHQTIKQDGVTGATVVRFGICETAADTVAKTVSVTTGTPTLAAGLSVFVFFRYSNTATNPTLNVNNTGAKAIKRYGSIAAGKTTDTSWLAESVVHLIYDGTYWYIAEGNNNVYKANTAKLVTTTVPNVTNKGTVPSLTITSTACDDITAWTTNTPSTVPTMSASEGVLTFTAGSNGTAASLSYTARSVGSASGWSAGTTPTLGTAITVATGSATASGTGATLVTGIATN